MLNRVEAEIEEHRKEDVTHRRSGAFGHLFPR
jgi:hypothetical protein